MSSGNDGKENKTRFVTVDTETIGRNLKNLRLTNGVSQQDIAAFLGITFQQVQKYESGRNRLSAERLYLLQQYFGVSFDRFFEGFDSKERQGPDMVSPDDSVAADVYRLLIRMEDKTLKNKIRKIVYILNH